MQDSAERQHFLDHAAALNERIHCFVTLTPDDSGNTIIAYKYEAKVGGKVAAVGGRLLDGAAKIIIRQFFTALGKRAGGGKSANSGSLLARLRALTGRRS